MPLCMAVQASHLEVPEHIARTQSSGIRQEAVSKIEQEIKQLKEKIDERNDLHQARNPTQLREHWEFVTEHKEKATVLNGYLSDLEGKVDETNLSTMQQSLKDITSQLDKHSQALSEKHPERIARLEKMQESIKERVHNDLQDIRDTIKSAGIELTNEYEPPSRFERAKKAVSTFATKAQAAFNELSLTFYEKIARNPEKAQQVRQGLIELYTTLGDELAYMKVARDAHEQEYAEQAQERFDQHMNTLRSFTHNSDQAALMQEVKKTAELIVKADIARFGNIEKAGIATKEDLARRFNETQQKLIQEMNYFGYIDDPVQDTDYQKMIMQMYRENMPSLTTQVDQYFWKLGDRLDKLSDKKNKNQTLDPEAIKTLGSTLERLQPYVDYLNEDDYETGRTKSLATTLKGFRDRVVQLK